MRTLILSIIALTLIACNLTNPAAVSYPSQITPTQVPPIVPTREGQITAEKISYWQSYGIDQVTPTADDIVIIDQIVLRRTESATQQSDDVTSGLQSAIGFMLMSENVWQGENLVLESATVDGDLATVRLTGQIRGVGGVILGVASQQIQLTVFEQANIERAIITLNGESIANIGISHSSQARDADFIYTKAALLAQFGDQ